MKLLVYTPRLRDRIAWHLMDWSLRLATTEYRLMLEGALEYGLRAAKRDAEEHRPVPPALRGF